MPASKSAKGQSAALIGVGRMGQALARNWIQDPQSAGLKSVALIDPTPSEAVLELAAKPTASLNPEPKPVDVLILAVKPQVFPDLKAELSAWADDATLVMSVMAGVTVKQLSQAFSGARVARCMPNTPGAIGRGVTGFCLSDDCKPADAGRVEKLLAPLGLVEGPIPEDQIEALTAVSGCGPAYVFLLTEVMAAAGRKLGLSQEVAERLARQTVIGAGALMEEDADIDPADLRRAVTSPNGVTQAALDVLMRPGGMPDLMREAAEAAAKRSYDLSQGG